MRSGLFPLLLLSLSVGLADPRAKVSDYPAHAESAHVAIGAEYLVHSFGNGRQTYFLPGFLVVDTAMYPHGTIAIKQAHFKLVLNGAGTLSPQTPETVAYALKSTDFMSDSGGRQRPQFPGDPSANRQPQPTQAPDPAHPERDPIESAEAALVRTALPEGEFHGPQSGFLYFAFSGKTKKIKSLDLVYTGDAAPLTVKLF